MGHRRWLKQWNVKTEARKSTGDQNMENNAIETLEALLTVPELASRLRVKPSWIYSHADDLGAYRCGKYLWFSWQRVIERLERCALAKSDLDVIGSTGDLILPASLKRR